MKRKFASLISLIAGMILLVNPGFAVHAQVLSFPAEINKSFTPISIPSGGISRLEVTVYNPNTFPLSSASWTDNLVGVQPGLSIANPANISNSCGGSVTAVSGTTTLSLNGGTVPAQVGTTPGECTVGIDVTSTTIGNLINTIPANELSSTGGGVSITNSGKRDVDSHRRSVAHRDQVLFSKHNLGRGDQCADDHDKQYRLCSHIDPDFTDR